MRKLVVLSVAFCMACSSNEPEPENLPDLRTLSAAETSLVAGNNQFAVNLFTQLPQDDPNLFFSPLSIGIALGMTLNGAEAETRQGILNTIQFGSLTAAEVNQGYADLMRLLAGMDRTVNLSFANSVWYRNPLTVRTDFKSAIESSYQGTVQGLDFTSPQAKQTINNWVESKTNTKIKNVIQQIDAHLVMFLINAIYFKGDWTYSFDKAQTKAENFYLEDGTIIQMPTMRAEKVNVTLYAHEKFNLITIPFGNKQFEFTVLLPRPGYTTADVTASLSAAALEDWIFNAHEQTVKLQMPKFKMKWKKNLNDELSALGMARAFIPGQAQLPNFFNDPLALYIDFVDHHSFLELTETGAEAAAVTVVGIGYTSMPAEPALVAINKPFVFMIREKHSGAITFMGQLKNPASLEE
ncbi:MAG: serpin family protein [Cyclobacteriaceae bacterium]|nr:serpin family protein [Cyclobacteriaceae bacterium]